MIDAPKLKSRRDFLLITAVLGLSVTLQGQSLVQALKMSTLKYPEFSGPMLDKIRVLLDQIAARKISSATLVDELTKLYSEFDLEGDYQRYIEPKMELGAKSVIFDYKNADAKLFFIKPDQAHPPHAHHDFASVAAVLKGTLYLRTYDRVKVVDSEHLQIKQTGDRVLRPNDSFKMTEEKNNIHWFGTEKNAAVMLTTTILDLPESPKYYFGLRGGRIYVDPTGAPDKNNFKIVKIIKKDEADAKFRRKPLSYFRTDRA